MQEQVISIRPFIGALNFEVSRYFYRDLGFTETQISDKLSLFKMGAVAFYLQQAYVKDWIDNTMVFAEVENVNQFYGYLSTLDWNQYNNARLSAVVDADWGSECFVHDPSGILWHFGTFK